MDYQSAVKVIDQLESEFSVEMTKYEEHYVWPILKYYLLANLLKISDTKEAPSVIIKKSSTSFYFKLINKIGVVSGGVKSYINFKVKWIFFKVKIKPVDYLVLDVKDSLYEDEIDGKKYSKYISPYAEFLNRDGNSILINTLETSIGGAVKIIPPIELRSKYFIDYKKAFNQLLRRGSKQASPKIECFKFIKTFFENKPYPILLDEELMTYLLDDVLLFEEFWSRILKVVKPKAVFFECYYGNLSNYGLISAAKKLSIKTIDIQHGISLGVNYLNWSKTPDGGYDFLPDYYWCWGNIDVNNVLKSRNSSKEMQPLLGGNLWLSKNIKSEIENPCNVLIKELIKDSKPRKVIIVSLQHSIPISMFLLDAIQKSKVDILWLIRFHPRDYLDPGYREAFIKSIEGLNNVEFEFTTKANLYGLFRFVDIHITHHSNVAVEAISFKIPTILLGDKFIELYSSYIEAKHFFIALNENEILNHIESDIRINEENYDLFKMQSDYSIAENLLIEIFKN